MGGPGRLEKGTKELIMKTMMTTVLAGILALACGAIPTRADQPTSPVKPSGTVLTDDCPVGLAAVARRTVRRAAAIVAGVLGLGAVGGFIERKLKAPPPPPCPIVGALPARVIPVTVSNLGTATPTTCQAPVDDEPEPR